MAWPFESLQPLTWEAFATLITGLLAVGAALIIGLRQVALLATQHAVQKTQADQNLKLRELEIKIAVLDRRSACIENIRPIWTRWIQDGSLSYEDATLLLSHAQQAGLVFSRSIYEDLIHFSTRISQVKRHYERSQDASGRNDKEDRLKWLNRAFALEDEIRPKFEDILGRMQNEARVTDDADLRLT
jgi:hypothetical protein